MAAVRRQHGIVALLDPGVYRWQIRIDTLALVWDDGVIQQPAVTYRLEGD